MDNGTLRSFESTEADNSSKFAEDTDESYPAVSIIIPCYNDGIYLNDAVESALAQTYPNVRIIIVNDASTDPRTLDILNSITHPRVTVFHNTENLRPSGTRNRGIFEAHGKYILPLDADDKIGASYVQKAVDIMESDPSVGVVYCKGELFGLESGPWDLPPYSLEMMMLNNVVFVTALFLRDDWEMIGGYSDEFKEGYEDYDFWLSILELGRRIHQIPEVLFYYRKKENSRNTNFEGDLPTKIDTYRRLYKKHPVFYDNHRDEYALKLRDSWLEYIDRSRHFENRVTAAEKRALEADRTLEQMTSSLSWRITKPLRLIMGIFRKNTEKKASRIPKRS